MPKRTTQLLAKGFTLIELLIVIALLGSLAMGLLATVDPFEQLKKGRDTSLRNIAAEYYNSNLRAYATKGQFTWGTGTTFTGSPLGAAARLSDITELINLGELKQNFIQLAQTTNLNKLLITSSAADRLAVCFKPESRSFQKDPITIFGTDGETSATTCKSQTSGVYANGTECHLCFQ